jgi:hypothetical protein
VLYLPRFSRRSRTSTDFSYFVSFGYGNFGLSIAIAVSTSSLEKFITARGLVYYTLFFCSSVFYPLSLIQQLGQDGKFPALLVTFAEVNPLSISSDMIRFFLLGFPGFSFSHPYPNRFGPRFSASLLGPGEVVFSSFPSMVTRVAEIPPLRTFLTFTVIAGR